MLLMSFSRSHVAGSRYSDIRTNRLIDMERNTILALDEYADVYAVDTATQSSSLIETRLNGRRTVFDPQARRAFDAD